MYDFSKVSRRHVSGPIRCDIPVVATDPDDHVLVRRPGEDHAVCPDVLREELELLAVKLRTRRIEEEVVQPEPSLVAESLHQAQEVADKLLRMQEPVARIDVTDDLARQSTGIVKSEPEMPNCEILPRDAAMFSTKRLRIFALDSDNARTLPIVAKDEIDVGARAESAVNEEWRLELSADNPGRRDT
jgi:hypothetical protein